MSAVLVLLAVWVVVACAVAWVIASCIRIAALSPESVQS